MQEDSTILQTASSRGHISVINILLAGLNSEERYLILKSGSPPPLFWAAYHDQPEAAETLLSSLSDKRKLDLLSATYKSQTARDVAIEEESKMSALVLMKYFKLAGG